MTTPAIETRGLRKAYGRTVALESLDIRVEAGEVFGFLGPNGAGKTTAVKLLIGLTRPTAGGGTVLGAPLGDLDARRRIGYLPELFRYQAWLTAREVLALHASLAGLDRAGRDAEIDRVLALVGLADRDRRPDRRVLEGHAAAARPGAALLGDPALVILDEPTSALDPVGRDDVRAIIREARERGRAVLLNSHLLGEVERLCDRVAIVNKGRVVAAGSLDRPAGRDGGPAAGHGPAGATTGCPGLRAGRAADGEGWLIVRGVTRDRIPDARRGGRRRGGRVHAVDPGRRSLEDLFLNLVRGRPNRAA